MNDDYVFSIKVNTSTSFCKVNAYSPTCVGVFVRKVGEIYKAIRFPLTGMCFDNVQKNVQKL